jgi:hypothetical protein
LAQLPQAVGVGAELVVTKDGPKYEAKEFGTMSPKLEKYFEEKNAK